MCTSPITLTKLTPLGTSRQYTVPCGKCSECRDSYQSQFEFLCAVEASKKGSLHFFTLTYDNDHLPVNEMWYDEFSDSMKVMSQTRGRYCYDWQLKSWQNDGCRVVQNDDAGECVPSLFRKDTQDWLKRYRSWCDRNDIPKSFSFAGFGEYGELKKRPHYHFLVAGLTNPQAKKLSDFWTNGFCLCKEIRHFNADGSDAFGLVSGYVSKYICKRDKLPDFVQAGFAELPRRQTSIGFGKGEIDIEKLRPFLFGFRPRSFVYRRAPEGNC